MQTQKTSRWILLVLALALVAPTGWAQQKQQKDPRATAPIEPVQSLATGESSSKDDPQPAGASRNAAPEQRPLNSIEEARLSTPLSRSYLNPTFHVTQLADSNSRNASTGETEFEPATLFEGRLDLQRFWGRYHLTTSYSGGGRVEYGEDSENYQYHSLGVLQRVQFRRWQLAVGDMITYLPESSFGFSGFGNLGGGGLGPANRAGVVNRSFLPNDTLLTEQSQRLSNTAVGQVLVHTSPRGSWTAAGSYGILHFLEEGLLDSRAVIVSSGYNYLMTPQDTLAVLYSFNRFSFDDAGRPVYSHSMHAGYGHQVSNRLLLQLSGGPEFWTVPVGEEDETTVSWGARASLVYKVPRGNLSLSYTHGTTAGAGLLRGARTHWVDLGYTRELTRRWSSQIRGGFARNSTLDSVSGGERGTVNTWHGGLLLHRALGRYTTMNFSYSLQRQSGNGITCVPGACGETLLRHIVGVGFSFTRRPQVER